MQIRKALGRGLDALIPSTEIAPEAAILAPAISHPPLGERIRSVLTDQIVPNRLQPRKTFNEESLKELAASIKEQGVIQPLIVTAAAGNRYELITGERRLRAAKLAGIAEVPVIIKNVGPEEMLEFSIIENIQREDLNPIEEAQAYKELISQFKYSQDEVADKLGRSRTAVANSLRLLNLPKLIQDDVSSGRLSAGHARALLSVRNLQEQLRLREEVLNSALTVRDIERMIQSLRGTTKVVVKRGSSLTPQMKHLVDEMTKSLATKVKLEPDREKKGGKIIIEYYSSQDLDRIYNVVVK